MSRKSSSQVACRWPASSAGGSAPRRPSRPASHPGQRAPSGRTLRIWSWSPRGPGRRAETGEPAAAAATPASPGRRIVGPAGQDVRRRGWRMAGRIRDEDIALVRERTSIADVISEHGDAEVGRRRQPQGAVPVPRREDARRSTSRPARNVYFCYGCGAGGDAIKFLMDAEHLSFVESVERLAGRAGIQLRYVEDDRRTARRVRSRGSGSGCSPRTPPRPSSTAAQLSTAGRPAGPGVPGPARLRPGRRRALRLRLRPGRLGPAHQAPAPAGLHRRGAGHRRAVPGGPLGHA